MVFVFLGVGIYLLLRNNNNHSQDEHTWENDIDTGTTQQEVEEIELNKV